MKPDVAKLVHRASAVSAGVATVLSPFPVLDEVVLLPIYGVLTWRIGRTHGLTARDVPWRPVSSTAFAGLIARIIVNLPFAAIPGVAAVANATSAVALTEWFGRYVDEACASPEQARSLGLGRIVEELRSRAKRATPA